MARVRVLVLDTVSVSSPRVVLKLNVGFEYVVGSRPCSEKFFPVFVSGHVNGYLQVLVLVNILNSFFCSSLCDAPIMLSKTGNLYVACLCQYYPRWVYTVCLRSLKFAGSRFWN